MRSKTESKEWIAFFPEVCSKKPREILMMRNKGRNLTDKIANCYSYETGLCVSLYRFVL